MHSNPGFMAGQDDTTKSLNGYSQQTDIHRSGTPNTRRTEQTQKTATVPKSQMLASNPPNKSIRVSSRKQSILMNGRSKQKPSNIRYHHHQLKHYHIPFDTYQQQLTRPMYCPKRTYPSGYTECPPHMTGGIATITPLATGSCRPPELSCHQQPELPTLVKVKAWYTVTKQGLTF